MIRECKIHGRVKHYKRKYRPSGDCSKCQVIRVSQRRRQVKAMGVEYLGNKCCKCGYDKCIAALEFHHIDPTTKEFSVGRNGHSRSWERTKKELDKCILLCANCHRELEYNEEKSRQLESW